MHDIITERKVISLRVYDIRFKLHHTSIFPTLSKDLEKSKKLATEL